MLTVYRYFSYNLWNISGENEGSSEQPDSGVGSLETAKDHAQSASPITVNETTPRTPLRAMETYEGVIPPPPPMPSDNNFSQPASNERYELLFLNLFSTFWECIICFFSGFFSKINGIRKPL